MKISTRARYALRVMIYISQLSNGRRPVDLRQIAKLSELPRGYLEQLMIALRKAKLVRGVSGRKGGYMLASKAADITLTDIVEAAIDPICLTGCITTPDACDRSPFCETRPIWVLINLK
ncbi:RrF2 family transcriptional regulator, partial [Acidobacteriota bacterium]